MQPSRVPRYRLIKARQRSSEPTIALRRSQLWTSVPPTAPPNRCFISRADSLSLDPNASTRGKCIDCRHERGSTWVRVPLPLLPNCVAARAEAPIRQDLSVRRSWRPTRWRKNRPDERRGYRAASAPGDLSGRSGQPTTTRRRPPKTLCNAASAEKFTGGVMLRQSSFCLSNQRKLRAVGEESRAGSLTSATFC